MNFTPPITTKLDDDEAERVHRNTDRQIRELQGAPMASAIIISGVVLPLGTGIVVPHSLGRLPRFIGFSAVTGAITGAGVIQDFGSVDPFGGGTPIDRTKFLSLRASSYGAPITVDILVM